MSDHLLRAYEASQAATQAAAEAKQALATAIATEATAQTSVQWAPAEYIHGGEPIAVCGPWSASWHVGQSEPWSVWTCSPAPVTRGNGRTLSEAIREAEGRGGPVFAGVTP